MTGRSLHDGLLRVLTSADLRARLGAADRSGLLERILGVEEVAVLRRADRQRLDRLARFLGRHFYRERIVRLFVASRTLARRGGTDPLEVLATAAFGAVLEEAEVGSAVTADRVAALVEGPLLQTLGGLEYARDLVTYEGALFRTEAGPRRWGADGEPRDGVAVRSAQARMITLEWDVTGLVAAARRGDATLPEPRQLPTRLLVALAPTGKVTTIRCPDTVARFLEALDGSRSLGEAAEHAGLGGRDLSALVRELAEHGAVEWRGQDPAR